jgi:hypothetical protein
MAVIEGSSSMVSILKWSWLENGEERRCEETWRSHGEGVEADRHLDYGEPNVRVNVISRTQPLGQRVGAGMIRTRGEEGFVRGQVRCKVRSR